MPISEFSGVNLSQVYSPFQCHRRTGRRSSSTTSAGCAARTHGPAAGEVDVLLRRRHPGGLGRLRLVGEPVLGPCFAADRATAVSKTSTLGRFPNCRLLGARPTARRQRDRAMPRRGGAHRAARPPRFDDRHADHLVRGFPPTRNSPRTRATSTGRTAYVRQPSGCGLGCRLPGVPAAAVPRRVAPGLTNVVLAAEGDRRPGRPGRCARSRTRPRRSARASSGSISSSQKPSGASRRQRRRLRRRATGPGQQLLRQVRRRPGAAGRHAGASAPTA